MASDLEGWLAPNRIYPGVADCMKSLMSSHEVYIVTTKQARFTETILRQMAGVEFPMDRIFSQTVSGRPKSEVLEQLEETHPGSTCHFVEDKLTTLEKVRQFLRGEITNSGAWAGERGKGWWYCCYFLYKDSFKIDKLLLFLSSLLYRWQSWSICHTGIYTSWTGDTTQKRRGRERQRMNVSR